MNYNQQQPFQQMHSQYQYQQQHQYPQHQQQQYQQQQQQYQQQQQQQQQQYQQQQQQQQYQQQHNTQIERTLMERGLFNTNTSKMTSTLAPTSTLMSTQESMQANMGEITGQNYGFTDLVPGMPVRSFLNEQKGTFNYNPYENTNPKLDYDLYNEQSQLNVKYFDPKEGNVNINFSNVDNNNKILQSSKNELRDWINVLNSITLKFNNYFKRKNGASYVLSPFACILPLIVLFRGSDGSTEHMLKTFFGFNKETAFNLTSQLLGSLYEVPQMDIFNLLFFPNTSTLNYEFVNYVKNIGYIDTINLSNPLQTIKKINQIFTHLSKGFIKRIASSKIINNNTCIVAANTFTIHPMWKQPFAKKNTQLKSFKSKSLSHYNSNPNSNHIKRMPTMIAKNVTANYYEDNYCKLIELSCEGGICMGFILSDQFLELPYEQLHYYINSLYAVNVGLLQIPKFKQDLKYRVNNIFHKMGAQLNNVELGNIAPTSNNLQVSDIIHRMTIYVDEGESDNIHIHNRTSQTHSSNINININFVLNRSFTYYLRKDDLILSVGYFY